VETLYATHGNPVKVVVHDGFTETDTNSVTGKTLNFSQRWWVNTYDLVAETRTVVGKAFVMTDPGKGSHPGHGRVVLDSPEHVSFEAGPHQVLHGNIDQLACSALAAP